jgi:hypothetical protein
MIRVPFAIPAIFGLFLMTACAPARTAETPQPAAAEPLTFQVTHNVPTTSSLVVYLIDPSGIRHRLGTVDPGQVGEFQMGARPAAGNFSLLAEIVGGRSLRSQPFGMAVPRGVSWDVERNEIARIIPDGG